MTAQEWESCPDPLRMLDAVECRARPELLRRFAVACCEPLLGILDDAGRHAVHVADRMARGEAGEAERTDAEAGAFWPDENEVDGERHCWDEEYVAMGYLPYQTDPRFAAAEAASGCVSADPSVAARVAAGWALAAAGADGQAAERDRLCECLRAILGNPFTVEAGGHPAFDEPPRVKPGD